MDPSESKSRIMIGLNAVVVAVTKETPRILAVKRAGHSLAVSSEASPEQAPPAYDALPFGRFDPAIDRTLELGLRRCVLQATGIEIGYAEQLYTFGDRNRDPQEKAGGPRVVSVAYLALVLEGRIPRRSDAIWTDAYRYFPWEDWREGRPVVFDRTIVPALDQWVESASDEGTRRARRERSDIVFGLGGAPWVTERVLDRFELLYEVGLAAEALREGDHHGPAGPLPASLGRPMVFDHRRILATALGRLRGKLKYRPVVFELLPAAFTLLQLQRVVEALAGIRLHKQNLRRLVETGGLVEGTGRMVTGTGGRPAELFRFRREVLRERPASGVGISGLHHA